MEHVDDVLQCIKSPSDNEKMSFKDLNLKCVIFNMLPSRQLFHTIHSLKISGMNMSDDCVFFFSDVHIA